MSLTINHIASGSSGNAVLVEDGRSKLLFDCGISYNKLARDVKFSEVSAVFITHEHLDHAKAAEELLRRGVKVVGSWGTKKALLERGMEVSEMDVVMHGSQIEVGSFYVKAFDVIHDAEEPLGFMYQSKRKDRQGREQKGIYIADSNYVQYFFNGITHFVIECNYAEDLLDKGTDEEFLKQRIRRSHFSFEKLQDFFSETDMSAAKEIHLIHLSSRNSHAGRFVDEIQKQTGVPTYVLQ